MLFFEGLGPCRDCGPSLHQAYGINQMTHSFPHCPLVFATVEATQDLLFREIIIRSPTPNFVDVTVRLAEILHRFGRVRGKALSYFLSLNRSELRSRTTE